MPNKTARWKDIQSKKQISQRNKLALILLVAIIVLLFLSQIVRFTQMLFSPWQQNPSVSRKILWNEHFNLNIILQAKDVSLVSFNPQDRKVFIINIPKNLYLEVSHGFGKWQTGSIYSFGQSQTTGGAKLLTDTLIDFFALPIDGFLQLNGKYSQKNTNEIVLELRSNPLSIIALLPFLKTSLTPFDLFNLKMGLSGVRFDKIKTVDLDSSLLQKEQLADGTLVYTADEIKLDPLLSNLKDPIIQSEHKTIAIFNSTNHPGLAQKAARLVANIGGDVIIISNSQNMLKTSKVIGEESKTLTRIKQIFEASDIMAQAKEDLVLSRAQINIFLGEDFAKL